MTSGDRCSVVQVLVLALVASTAAVVAVGSASPAAAVEAPPAFVSEWGGFGGVPEFPAGVAADPTTGDLYVSDSFFNARMLKFDSNGDSLFEFSSLGSGQGQLSGPRGVAVDPSTGDVYVADANNHRVLRFDSNGAYVSQLGTSGSGDGEFTFPEAVAVDPSTGDVYVTDNMYAGQSGDRVQKFDSNGTYLTQWGGFDFPIFGWIGFDSPRGIAVDPSTGDVYVADEGAVLRFDSDGTSLSVLGYTGSGDGQFDGAVGVAVDPSTGDVYVAETGNDRVQKFDTTGDYLTQWDTPAGLNPGYLAVDPSTGDVLVAIGNWDGGRVQRFDSTGALLSDQFLTPGSGRFDSPAGVEVDPSTGDVYVADSRNDRVQRFDSTGAFSSQFGSRGSGPGEFDRPGDVDVDGSGNIYVAEHSRVQKFDSTGAFVLELGSLGSGSGGFDGAGVGVNTSTGDVYVTDSNNDRVQRFNSNGAFLSQFGTSGSGDGEFCRPVDVAVDDSGDVYVADYCNGRVQKFDSDGTYLIEWGTSGDAPGEFSGATDVEIDGSGDVYVADPFNDRVQKFDSNGNLLALWGTPGTGPSEFDLAWGVAANPSTGDLYVTDSRNDRVQRFTASSSPAGVSGTVTSSGSGVPVAGAWVAVLRQSDFSIAAAAVADGSGDYQAQVPPGSYFLYVIDPSGSHTAGFHGPPTQVVVNVGAMSDADPVMPSLRGSITATVTETGTNDPIAGVWGLALSTTGPNTGAAELAVTANGSGQLTLPGLTPGNHFVGFVDPTGAHATRFYPNSPNVPDATPVAVTAGGTTPANVSLPAQNQVGTGATISGTLTEQGTGTPLAGARVVALRESDYAMVRGAVTNASGQYRLDLADGGYKLVFLDSTGRHDAEWYDNQPNTALGAAATVTAPGTANAALNANTGSMTGTITDDPTGTPIPGAWVIAIGPTGIAGGAVTGADGTYTISGLAPGTYRATFADPNGGRTQEYWNNSPDFTGATTINITAANTVTVNAALTHP